MTPVEKARLCKGVKWVHQGRDPVNGLDCAGLLVHAFGAEGEHPNYGREPANGQMESTLERYMGAPVLDGPKVGDAVAIAYKGVIRHCGIIGDHPLGGLSLIHTDSILGCVTEHALDGKWMRRVKKVYRR